MKKIFKALLTGAAPLTIITTASLATSCGQLEKHYEPMVHKESFFKTKEVAKTIYAIDGSKWDGDMNTTLQSLQGILAQDKAEVFVYSGLKNRDEWFFDMQHDYKFKVVNIENPWDLILKFKDRFNSKFVLYTSPSNNSQSKNTSINNATAVSGVEKYLMISDNLKDEAESYGLIQAEDVTDTTVWTPLYTLNKYKNELNKTIMLNQAPVDYALRDYAIAGKMFAIYMDYEDQETIYQTMDEFLDDEAPILGWTTGELEFLPKVSAHKMCMVAADHCFNLSLYSSYKPKGCYVQTKRPKIKVDPAHPKHYVAIVMSDGDNVQWMQNDFRFANWYGSPYRGQFPMTWTIGPAALDMNPSILDNLYSTMTPNDYFMAGPSGFTYINPQFYPKSNIGKFAEITADYMHDMDLTCFNPLDYNDGAPDPERVKQFEPFLKNDQIKGGVWSVDGLYLDGHGSIDWFNNKPIVSFREGLWDKGYLRYKEAANRINNIYPRDPTIIDGYTLVLAQAWTEGKMNKVKLFADSLADDVELVTVDQMFDLMVENITNKVSDVPDDYPRPE